VLIRYVAYSGAVTINGVTTHRSLDTVKGWFSPLDQTIFRWVLEWQRAEPAGDLVELGVYLGKSAVLIGSGLRPGERFTVCDLFGDPGDDVSNQEECDQDYGGLTRAAFEKNYLAFHSMLPTVVQGPTSAILQHVPAGSCRFAHIDASHIYDHVTRDVASTRLMLRPTGVAVFDDFLSAHTPGTVAAVWEAVLLKGLHPICFTRNKLYGTWGDPAPARTALADWLARQSDIGWECHDVGGRRLLRMWLRNRPRRGHWYDRWMPQAARRRTSQTVAAMSSTDSASSQPPSIHWNGQNRLTG
jgi:Methyltransferase domain